MKTINADVTKIYVNYFSDARLISNPVLNPIQVGRASSKTKLDMLGDDTGDNISKLNPSYCELTGIYWAWKNDLKSDNLGFMHYRRFLDFHASVGRTNETPHGIIVDKFNDDFIDEFGLTEERVSEILNDCDGIIPKAFNVVDLGSKTVEQHYKNNDHHHIKDFRLAEKIVSEIHPNDTFYFKQMAKGKILYPCNIFVFKRDLFVEYCEWLFPILDQLHNKIDTSNYTSQAKRVIGFLSERLFTTFILKKQQSSPELRFTELRMVFVTDTTPKPVGPKRPISDVPVISIVASSDRTYLPHLSALIHSIFDNSSKDSFIDFIVLDGGLTEDETYLLKRIPESYKCQGRITFINMSRQFLGVKTHSYFPTSTLYRLMLPEMLEDYDRILFIDTDMIVLADLKELYNIDMNGKSIAAAKDLIMRTFIAGGVKSIQECGGKVTSIYLSQYLYMGKKIYEYFQAGTILFDLNKMRENGYSSTMQQDILDRKYWFLDQDVLNKNLFGDVFFIDNKWNSTTIDPIHIDYLNESELKIYNESIDRPFIIHFAGENKPWVNDKHPMSHHYWYYLRKTHWFEKVLKSYINQTATIHQVPDMGREPSLTRRVLRTGWRALPASIRRRLLPIGTKISQSIR